MFDKVFEYIKMIKTNRPYRGLYLRGIYMSKIFVCGVDNYKERAVKLNHGYAQLRKICLGEKLKKVVKLIKKGAK